MEAKLEKFGFCKIKWSVTREEEKGEEQVLLGFARLPNENYPYRI
jgi:hypothetical protein